MPEEPDERMHRQASLSRMLRETRPALARKTARYAQHLRRWCEADSLADQSKRRSPATIVLLKIEVHALRDRLKAPSAH
jgi:hypothetical protein